MDIGQLRRKRREEKMSSTPDGLEDARKFFAQLMKEPGNLKAVQSDLVRVANDRGFECTAEDLTKALQEIWDKSKGEMFYSERPGF
jgi:hypothetical protein